MFVNKRRARSYAADVPDMGRIHWPAINSRTNLSLSNSTGPESEHTIQHYTYNSGRQAGLLSLLIQIPINAVVHSLVPVRSLVHTTLVTQSVYDDVTDGASSPTVWFSSFTLPADWLNCSSFSPLPLPAPPAPASFLYRSITA